MPAVLERTLYLPSEVGGSGAGWKSDMLLVNEDDVVDVLFGVDGRLSDGWLGVGRWELPVEVRWGKNYLNGRHINLCVQAGPHH
jgi:hypothetical protein